MRVGRKCQRAKVSTGESVNLSNREARAQVSTVHMWAVALLKRRVVYHVSTLRGCFPYFVPVVRPVVYNDFLACK